MEKVKETDIKLYVHNEKLYMTYDSGMKIVKRHDKLVDKMKGITND